MNYRADFHAPFSFVGTDTADIANDNWKIGESPKSYFQLTYVENYGFLINLISEDKNPKSDYAKKGEPAYLDTALGFFVNFDPENSDKYIEFWFSAGGAVYASVGEAKENRTELTEFYKDSDIITSVHDEDWDVIALIPNEVIYSVYGKLNFKPGYSFRANMVSSCSEGENKHYASWSPIVTEAPDFHTPEQFGYITLDKSIDNI